MAALFPPWANTAFYLCLGAAVLGLLAVIVGPMIYVRTPYSTDERVAPEQPVEFDHRHHVRDDGIDCLFCHPDAERAAKAGVPSTAVCMGCHTQIWPMSPLLEPVRHSMATGAPIRWRRVHNLPDFVYFNHSVHVRDGIDCSRCHGRVRDMARVYKTSSLHMIWCLDCHREREGRALSRLTTCTACHR